MKKKYLITSNIGNTNQSYCVFENYQIREGNLTSEKLNDVIKKENLTNKNTTLLTSSVSDSKIESFPIQDIMIRHFFKTNSFLEMPVDYSSTLGDDRLAAAYYLYAQNDKPKIIIDSGSFTTIDIVTKLGFQGGIILPGLRLIEESFLRGENLKKYAAMVENLAIEKLPKDSASAVQSGMKLSFLAPIREFMSLFPDHDVYLTGGNAKRLESGLRGGDASIHLAENLIHTALCYIAQRI